MIIKQIDNIYDMIGNIYNFAQKITIVRRKRQKMVFIGLDSCLDGKAGLALLGMTIS